MLNKGDILGGRYEIVEKIGTGGMADVYKGRDHKLNRFIAIKVLKAEYSSNKNFVSKFKVEAQSAAGLMHQNIVNVYDVGEENGIYYFVMELVEGITLKNYIDKKIRLSIKEALSIAIQVSNGIEAAHNNGIIHRDIKPQNIIISREGKVKVADFGIARAATSDTITSHAMGSVHYTSPEQARGGYSDAKSDIYSIGITLFEMVTGRVPFDGETTVSIAIKHIQEDMPSPKIYVPDIPISVEKIIFKCTQKNPDRRYYNMAELIKDLKQALITPDEDFVEIRDARSNEGTKVMPENNVKASLNNVQPDGFKQNYPDSRLGDSQQIYVNHVQNKPQAPYSPYEFESDDEDEYDDGDLARFPLNQERGRQEYSRYEEEDVRPRDRARGADPRNSRVKQQPKNNAAKSRQQVRNNNYDSRGRSRNDDLDNDVDPKMEKVMTVMMIIAAIVVALVAIFLVGRVVGLFGKNSAKTEIAEGYTLVPDVVGLDIASATKALDDAGLKAKAKYEPSTEYDKDIICGQSPASGEQIEEGSVLELVISSGKVQGTSSENPPITMGDGEGNENAKSSAVPDVVGKTEAEARVLIENEGFVMVKELTASTTVEKGIVVSQTPLGANNAPQGSQVLVYISDGPDVVEVVVPDIVGKTKEEAIKLLADAKLIYKEVKEENNDTVAAGNVLSQTVAAGTTVEEGATVDFTVSKGPIGYTCSFSIAAPSDYLEGTEAIIVLMDPAGNQIESVSTTTFPYSLVKSGIAGTNSGVITVTYQKTDGTWDTSAPASVTFTQE